MKHLQINVAEAGDRWIVKFPTGNVIARDRATVVDLVRDWVEARGNVIATIVWEADDGCGATAQERRAHGRRRPF